MLATATQRDVYTEESTELQALFAELDKGIDDMEAGRVVPHEETMSELRQMVRDYELQNRRNP